MAPSSSFTAILFLGCTFSLLSYASSSNAPFPSELIGKTITRIVSGLRFPVREQVIISESTITYRPRVVTFVGPRFAPCDEKLIFSINRNSKMVTITKLPDMTPMFDFGKPKTQNGTCAFEQEKLKAIYSPTGPTSAMFRNQTKRIVAGLNGIQLGDTRAIVLALERTPRPPCGRNPQVEAVIGYLRTVAFENNFSAE